MADILSDLEVPVPAEGAAKAPESHNFEDIQALLLALLVESPGKLWTLKELRAHLGSIGAVELEEAKLYLLLADLAQETERVGWCPYCVVERFAADQKAWTVRWRNAWVGQFVSQPRGQHLTPRQLEVLACVAFKQPVTRNAIKLGIGFDPYWALNVLVQRGLVLVNRAGAYSNYETTPVFLEKFGLRNLDQIPNYSEYRTFAEQRWKKPRATADILPTPAGEPAPSPGSPPPPSLGFVDDLVNR